MHNLKGLEKLNSKFYTMQETVVDIEVKTSDAEDAMEEAQVVSAEIDEDLDVVEGASDEIETLRLYQEHLKKYPLTKANYSLINLNNSLSKYSNQLVAVESFNDNITNDIVIAGIEGIVSNVVEKVKSIVKGIIDKFKVLLDKIKMAVGNWEGALEAAQRLIQTIPDTPAAETSSRVVSGVEFKQCDQVITGIESVSAKIQNIGDILSFEGNNLVLKSIVDIADKQTLDSVGFNKPKYPPETKIDAAKFNKQELSSMCSKLIKSCQSLDKLGDLLWNMIENIPALLDTLVNKNISDVLIKSINAMFNTSSAQLQRNLRDILDLEGSAANALITCNNSFIRIVKARAKA